MKQFDFHSPQTISSALALLAQYGSDCSVIAGGTDIVIALNERASEVGHLININQIDALRYIKHEDGLVKIGPLTTFTELENDPYVKEHLKALYDTAVHVGSPQIRNLGTIGGNVVNASVAGDSPTTLMTYGASLVLSSSKGQRVMTIEDFNKGPGNCQIQPDELLTEISFPVLSKDEAAACFKIGKRKSLAIVVLATGIYVRRDGANTITDARVVLGAVSMHPMRAPEIEAALVGRKLTRDALNETLPLFTDAICAAIANRPSVVYKRESVRGAARLCYEDILSQLGLA
ncbi:MAG: xanthine dehydrogenase family protein subunit M [Pseudoflavonifractor sp.]